MTGAGLLRRRSRAGVAVAAVAVAAVVAGCGGGGGGETAVPGAPPSEDGAFPVTIEHKFGSTTVDAEPRRVVTVGYTDQDPVLALGVVPVATTEWYGDKPGALYPWAREKLGGAPLPTVLPSANPVPFEQIAAQEPDLILSVQGGLQQADYDRLSQIAPTVTQPPGVQNYGVTWQDQARTIGKALGRSAQADRLVGDVEAKFASIRTSYPQFAGKTAVPATWMASSGGWYVYSGKDPRGQVLRGMGLTVPPGIDQLTGQRFGATLSFERSDLLDVDAQVWLPLTPADEQAIRSSPGFATSRAATEGRALFVQEGTGTDLDPLSGFITVLSLPKLLDTLPPQVAAVIDGNPTTTPPAVPPSS